MNRVEPARASTTSTGVVDDSIRRVLTPHEKESLNQIKKMLKEVSKMPQNEAITQVQQEAAAMIKLPVVVKCANNQTVLIVHETESSGTTALDVVGQIKPFLRKVPQVKEQMLLDGRQAGQERMSCNLDSDYQQAQALAKAHNLMLMFLNPGSSFSKDEVPFTNFPPLGNDFPS